MKQGKAIKKPSPRCHEETLTYRVIVTDTDGKVLHDISAPSKSFVRQWNIIINVQARRVNLPITDTNGNGQTCSTDAYSLDSSAGIGDASIGFRVGKGAAAVTINDYALQTPLAEGVGVDQLNHQAMEFTEPATVGPTCSFTMRRSMINNSGATITGVRELGLYVTVNQTPGPIALGFRDVLGAGVDVPDGGAITVEYTLGVTV